MRSYFHHPIQRLKLPTVIDRGINNNYNDKHYYNVVSKKYKLS